MNIRIVFSAAAAAGVFFAAAPMQAQAPALSNTQKMEVKIADLQAQVNALQAQVKRLQSEVRVLVPRRGVTPIDQLPNIQTPNSKIEPFQNPGIQGFQFPNGSFQPPSVQTFTVPPAHLFDQRPQPYWNIPPCSVILIQQKTH